jgi:hypothetical protein
MTSLSLSPIGLLLAAAMSVTNVLTDVADPARGFGPGGLDARQQGDERRCAQETHITHTGGPAKNPQPNLGREC